MVKIPYRILIAAILVLVGLAVVMAPASGDTGRQEEEVDLNAPPIDAGTYMVVVEQTGVSDDGDAYFVYLNKKYYYTPQTEFEGVTRSEVSTGDWLIVDIERKEGEQAFNVVSVTPAPADEHTMTGTIGALLKDDNETIGFTINDFSILLPHEEGEHGHDLEVGMGVKVEVTPVEGSEMLQAHSISVLRHHDLKHAITVLMLQIAVILLVAKFFGEIFERYLKQPAVLGEILGGIIISPYALGHMIVIPGIGSLFETFNLSSILKASPLQPNFAVSPELWAIAQMASIVLLFMAGLETDLGRFLRYAGPATVIGLGGVITPFILGILATVWFIPHTHWMDPTPLFMGAIMVATSVGITARVLSDIKRLDTSEGVTILAGAVIEDVIGILVLAIVNSIAIAELAGQEIEFALIGEIAIKAVLFWLGLTFLGILASKKIQQALYWFKSKGATFALGLSIAFAAAATAEMFGLAMIIGAYSIGLALSERDLAHYLEERLTGVYNFIVPVFFVVMGMLVDLNAMMPLLWPYGVVISIFAVVSKIFGCGIPAMFVGFNKIGAWRVGVGMLPRGEVALIIAGVGIANGIIATDMFGVAILVTLVTTVMAPPLLVPAFQSGGAGTHAEREEIPAPAPQTEEDFMVIPTDNESHRRLLKDVMVDAFELQGFEEVFSDEPQGIYELMKLNDKIVLRYERKNGDYVIAIDTNPDLRDTINNTLSNVSNLMGEYRERLREQIEESDPDFFKHNTPENG